ncbi:MAG: hypothetical protein Q7O12_02360 [Deltaproteobacteria bacterium]|nr:hypothetical protein [Deltaproteobacteria bacterium]
MIDLKKLILSIFVIIIAISFSVKYSISQNKPSEEVIKHIILDIDYFYKNVDLKKKFKDIKFKELSITNSFISKQNGRYCILVNYNLIYKKILPESHPGASWKVENDKRVNKRYSFKKEGKKWYGWEGWGEEINSKQVIYYLNSQ